jgi:hypothetical protein
MSCETWADLAAAQCFEELCARVWIVDQLLPGAGPPDDERRRRLARLARDLTIRLGDGSASRADDARRTITRLLWPTFGAPPRSDPWWQTPLGQLLGATPRNVAREPSRASVSELAVDAVDASSTARLVAR